MFWYYHYCQEEDKLIRLWIHEIYRVFYDRLIDEKDKETFFGIVQDRTIKFFKHSMDKVRQIQGNPATERQLYML